MKSQTRRFEAGLIDGAAATLVMSSVMYTAQRAGLLGEMPPRKITRKLLTRFAPRRPSGPQIELASTAAHLGFGALAGGLYALGTRFVKRAPRTLLGVLFATGVWALSYWKVVPALGIMRKPPSDRPGRPTTMLIAHWVFGATLGALFGHQERRDSARDSVA